MLQRSEKENHKNYLEKGTIDLGSEPLKFEYKEIMIHKIFVYNILWLKLVNQKKKKFF